MKKHSTIFLGLLLCASHFIYCSDYSDPGLEFSSFERRDFERRRALLDGMKQQGACDGNSMSDRYAIALAFANHQRKLGEEVKKAREAARVVLAIKEGFDGCFPAEIFGGVSEKREGHQTLKPKVIGQPLRALRRRRAGSCDGYYGQAEEKGDPKFFYGERSPASNKKGKKSCLDCLRGKLEWPSKDKNK